MSKNKTNINSNTKIDTFFKPAHNNSNSKVEGDNDIISIDDDDNEVQSNTQQQTPPNVNLTPTKKSLNVSFPTKPQPKIPQPSFTPTSTTTNNINKTNNNNNINNNNPTNNNVNSSSNNNSNNVNKYSFQANFKKKSMAPLSEQMRPTEFKDFIGQEALLSDNSIVKQIFQSPEIPSFILYGPPGCGKTTLAQIVATKSNHNLIAISAVGTGVKDMKEAIDKARNTLQFGKKTILFVDEIHRYNKLQQDMLLPAIESGVVILIGATTENPSFEINSALLSRCKVFRMEKLTKENIEVIIRRTLEITPLVSDRRLIMDDETIKTLAEISDGDARVSINVLDMAIKASKNDQSYKEQLEDKSSGVVRDIHLTKKQLGVLLQRTNLVNDKGGDNFYELISALHKSVRGSDPNATAYWVIRMLESGCDPIYIARRMIRMASEDVGIADNQALPLAIAAYQAVHFVGMPECSASVLQCAVYLASAAKSNSTDLWYAKTKEYLENHDSPPIPIHLRNAPTKLMKSWGYGAEYQYNHAFDNQEDVTQIYLPDSIKNETFFQYKLTCPSLKDREEEKKHQPIQQKQQQQQHQSTTPYSPQPIFKNNIKTNNNDINPTLPKKQKIFDDKLALTSPIKPNTTNSQADHSINSSILSIDNSSECDLNFDDQDYDIVSLSSTTTTISPDNNKNEISTPPPIKKGDENGDFKSPIIDFN